MTFHIRSIQEKKPRRNLLKALPWKRVLGIGMMLARPLWEIGKGLRKKHQHREHMKRAFSVGIAIVVALSIILLAFSLLVKMGGFSATSLLKVSGTPVGMDENGVTNILLMGQGDLEHDGIDLTDSIMIASIDPKKTKGVVMLSLPRDLYFLHTDSMETEKGKLNALWRDNRILLQKGGMEYDEASVTALKQLAEEIGNALQIPIHHVVKVDFTAFQEVVDAIGGIDIEVPETIHDTEFPGPNYSYQTFHIDAGMQHLDGATALKYARTRHTSSDFDRSARQQQVLRAMAKKAQVTGLLRKPRMIMDLYAIVAEHLETDLQTRQMITLADAARSVSQDRFSTLQLNNVNGLYGDQLFKAGILYSPPRDLFDGVAILLPVSIPEFPVTWKQIRLLTKLFFGQRSVYFDEPRFVILNGGAKEGSAGRMYRELTKYGFDVVEVTNVPGKRDIEESYISRSSEEVEDTTVTFFSAFLSLPLVELPERMQEKAIGDVTIVLGKDFTFRFFQDLPLPEPLSS